MDSCGADSKGQYIAMSFRLRYMLPPAICPLCRSHGSLCECAPKPFSIELIDIEEILSKPPIDEHSGDVIGTILLRMQIANSFPRDSLVLGHARIGRQEDDGTGWIQTFRFLLS